MGEKTRVWGQRPKTDTQQNHFFNQAQQWREDLKEREKKESSP